MAKQFTHDEQHVDQDFRAAHDAVDEALAREAGLLQVPANPRVAEPRIPRPTTMVVAHLGRLGLSS